MTIIFDKYLDRVVICGYPPEDIKIWYGRMATCRQVGEGPLRRMVGCGDELRHQNRTKPRSSGIAHMMLNGSACRLGTRALSHYDVGVARRLATTSKEVVVLQGNSQI